MKKSKVNRRGNRHRHDKRNVKFYSRLLLCFGKSCVEKTCTAIINALRRGGVCTLEDLRNMPEEELKTLRGIGNERLKVLLELKGQKTLRNYFTFRVVGGEVPKVTIEGKQLAVVTCVYNWSTSTDKSSGTENVVVGGYLDGGLELKIFKLDFKTNMANEI